MEEEEDHTNSQQGLGWSTLVVLTQVQLSKRAKVARSLACPARE